MKVENYSEFSRSQNETGEKTVRYHNLQGSRCV